MATPPSFIPITSTRSKSAAGVAPIRAESPRSSSIGADRGSIPVGTWMRRSRGSSKPGRRERDRPPTRMGSEPAERDGVMSENQICLRLMDLLLEPRRRVTRVWRINKIKRLSEFGTSLDNAFAIGTNRDQLVIQLLPEAVPE